MFESHVIYEKNNKINIMETNERKSTTIILKSILTKYVNLQTYKISYRLIQS